MPTATLNDWGVMQGEVNYQNAFYEATDGLVHYTLRDEPETDEKSKPKNRQLIKQMDMDITDLLLHLFKGQPRITKVGFYAFDKFYEGRRHFERDEAMFRGQYVIYFKSSTLAVITSRPHKKIKFLAVNKARRAYFAQQLLRRVAHDLFPEAKIEE